MLQNSTDVASSEGLQAGHIRHQEAQEVALGDPDGRDMARVTTGALRSLRLLLRQKILQDSDLFCLCWFLLLGHQRFDIPRMPSMYLSTAFR